MGCLKYGIGNMKSLYLAVLAFAISLTPMAASAAVRADHSGQASVSKIITSADYDGRGHRSRGHYNHNRGSYGGDHRTRVVYSHRGDFSRGGYNQWNRSWHNDRQYDWRSHRNNNRHYYRPVQYYSPYRGHSYNQVNIGYQMNDGYYNSRYYVNNPGYYRLPTAYGPYRWVRYYNDVLLIDLRSGYVVDKVHNFYW